MHLPLFIHNDCEDKVVQVSCCVNVFKGRVLYLETNRGNGNCNDRLMKGNKYRAYIFRNPLRPFACIFRKSLKRNFLNRNLKCILCTNACI